MMLEFLLFLAIVAGCLIIAVIISDMYTAITNHRHNKKVWDKPKKKFWRRER